MKPVLPALFFAACFFAFARPGDATADSVEAALPPEAAADFAWFSTLGFPDVRGCPAAHVTTGRWNQIGAQTPEAFPPSRAFLLRHGDDGRFTVLTPDLFTRDYTTTPPGTPEYKRVGYEEASLAAEADAFLDEFARPPATDSEKFRRRFRERVPERTEVFVWAWACWRNGLGALAARLYERAAAMPKSNARDPETTPFRERLESDLGYAMIWRATLDFDDLTIPRVRLLESFERIAHDYPASEYASRARETADLLRTMVAEDAAHSAQASVPPASLPPEQRAAELIFRLRDQHGRQDSQPGSCDVFSEDRFGPPGKTEEEKSPAMQLVDLGFAAVPPLIAAMDDKHFSRSVGFWRDFVFSHHVLTVGECVRLILDRIAGQENYFSWSSSGKMSSDDEIALARTHALAWWKDVQQKGEKQTLIDAVIQGGRNAQGPARRLCERYPDAALAPIIEGVKHSSEDWARAGLVVLAGELPGDDGVPFFKDEMSQGPHLEERLEAARALWQHGHPDEAVAAVIHEWEKLQNVRPGEENERDNLPQGLIAFLNRCERVDAMEALGRNLRQRLVSVRMDVVRAMMPPDPSLDFGSVGKGADDEAKVASACEALLISELDDNDERFGMSALIYNQPVNDPRMGDVAGEYLAQRFPGKYTYDISATPKQRERQRLACLNVWRREHGQEALPAPPEQRIAPAPEDVVLPALRTVATSDDFAERSAVDAVLAKLGVAALAPLRAFMATLPVGDPGRTRLENEEELLACTVTQTELQIANPVDEVWRRQFQEQLDAWKNQPLTSTKFIALVVDLAGKLWQGIGGFDLRAIRDEDLGGVRVILKLLPAATRSGLPTRWQSHEGVMLANKALCSSTGSTDPAILERWNQHLDWVHSADKALGAPADQPFSFVVFADGEP